MRGCWISVLSLVGLGGFERGFAFVGFAVVKY